MTGRVAIVSTRDVFFAHDTETENLHQFCDGLDQKLREKGFALLTFRDEVGLGDTFFDKIRSQIRRSAFVIADIGCRQAKEHEGVITNANVALEIGVADGLGKTVVFLARRENLGKLPSNLRSRDVVLYPDCLQVGNPEFRRFEKLISQVAQSVLVAEPIRIFQNAGVEYQTILRQVTALEGEVYYVSNHLRAFFRPKSAEDRWLKQVRGVAPGTAEGESDVRRKRKEDWQHHLCRFPCTDLYERFTLEDDVKTLRWRSFAVTREEMSGFLSEMKYHIETFPRYSVGLIDEILNFKFWIKDSIPTGFVVLEGLEYENLGKHIVGGVVFSSDDVVKKFKQEYSRLLSESRTIRTRDDILKWIEGQLASLEKYG